MLDYRLVCLMMMMVNTGIIFAGGYAPYGSAILCTETVQLWDPVTDRIEHLPVMKQHTRIELALVYVPGLGTFALGTPQTPIFMTHVMVRLICI